VQEAPPIARPGEQVAAARAALRMQKSVGHRRPPEEC
jgi:hypothetical protein